MLRLAVSITLKHRALASAPLAVSQNKKFLLAITNGLTVRSATLFVSSSLPSSRTASNCFLWCSEYVCAFCRFESFSEEKLERKSGATFYLVIDRNAKGQQTVHFMNLVDEADLLALMEEEDADAYTAEKEAAAQAEQDRLKSEEEAKTAAEETAASGTEQPKENKVTKSASGFLGVVVLIALAAGGGFYAFAKQKQKKQAEKEALDPDAGYTEDKGDFEIPTEDEPEEPSEEDTEPI